MYNYVLKYKLKRYYKKNSRENGFLNLKDVHTVLVLFDTEQLTEASRCIDQLKNLGKEVTVYAYITTNGELGHLSADYHILSRKAAGKWFGNPLYALAKELEQKSFDAVIDLTVRRNFPLEYLLACARATVKTGLKKSHFSLYDLAITPLPGAETKNGQVEELGKQILYYLDTIKTPQAMPVATASK
ncbi:MAG: hypothetical protein LBB85_09265 [Dysgonamonadaceae bacterium]|jgi:hypothetical protein|nr:hypothetical protein [Dysgonamonadaceae bacterium]